MLAVLVRVTAPTQEVETPNLALVEDVVWAAAEPRDCLEHVTVEVDRGLVSIMTFVRAADKEHAEAQAGALIGRAVHRAVPFRGWRVLECSAVDL
ncbi:hypothetical protein ABH931_007684 [Streptacidiphilus sp. MAP12-33]|jgi:hypothetical protein|uniref:hypothetical protein n=1 Tax=Streptacidiphilus sp. MAP12-33 TaxID=3156266 RepID=UPI003511E241